MSNELVPKNTNTNLSIFDDASEESSSFLPRIQLFTGRSDAVGEGRIGVNHWGMVDGDETIDLGVAVDIGVLTGRHKAMCVKGDVVSSHDPESELFKDLVVRSGQKNSGCMYGPDFLVYVPSVDKFASLFMGSKTARREAKKFKPLMGKPATLKSKLIDPPKSEFKWQGPVVLPCDKAFDVPETVQSEIEKFLNPPEDSVEMAADDGRDV